MLCAI